MAPPLSTSNSSEFAALLSALNIAPNRPDIVNIPEKEKKSPSNILRIISSAESGESRDRRRQVVFCADLWDLCHSAKACAIILQKPELKSLGDVALFLFSSDSKDRGLGLVVSEVSLFESALFEKEPASALLALHRRGELGVEPDSQAKVLNVLERAVKDGADLRKESLLDFAIENVESGTQTATGAGVSLGQVRSLQRLVPVVQNPRAITYLLKSGLTSAHMVAACNRGDFLDSMEQLGCSTSIAADIHSRAGVIDMRNEDLWSEFLRSRTQVPLLSVEGQVDVSKDPEPDKSVPINLTTLFNEMDSVEYDETNSVLSPAAYLVDLLQLLKKRKVTDTKTLLDLFEERRSDIAHLQLSKANTTKLVAYNGLANEVMEAFIRKGLGNSAAPVAMPNERDDTEDSSQFALPDAGGIYVSPIGEQSYPISSFPYNNAVFSTRELLHAAGHSRLELLKLFRSDAALSRSAFGSSDSSRHLHVANLANDRRWAAEVLNLQHCDWVAITTEGFYSLDFVRNSISTSYPADQTAYLSFVKGHPTASYWGYKTVDQKNSAENQMTNNTSLTCLSKIRDQLLPRSGLSFEELVRVLNTKFIGRRLAISPEYQGKYSERLGDFRLLETSPRSDVKDPTVSLSEGTCQSLQAFIRLWKRSGLAIDNLDDALVLFARRNYVDGEEAARTTIDCQTLESLAQIKAISELVGLEIGKLLPFWGLENDQAQAALFNRLFTRSKLAAQYLEVNFHSLVEAKKASIADVSTALKLAFNTNDATLADMVSAADLQPNDKWTATNMMKLYRVSLLSQMTQIPTGQIPAWLNMFSSGRALFESPKNTLSTLLTWQNLASPGLPAKDIFQLVTPPKEMKESPALPFLQLVLRTFDQITQKYAGLSADRASQSVESLTDSISVMYSDLFTTGDVAEVRELVKGIIHAAQVSASILTSDDRNNGHSLESRPAREHKTPGKSFYQGNL